MKHWYYAVEGSVSGPVGMHQLIDLIDQESLLPETLVWAQGLAEWIPAGEAAEQFGSQRRAGEDGNSA